VKLIIGRPTGGRPANRPIVDNSGLGKTSGGGGKEKIVEYLQDARILRRELYCQPCQRDYTMVKNKVSIVGYMLRCPGCHRKQQLQTGTFLEGSRLQVDKFVGLLFLWAHEAPIKMVLSMTGSRLVPL